MESNRVLVVSDSPDRTNFLSYHIRTQGMMPVRYPNYLSAMHALRADPFSIVVVDLTLPMQSKLELIKIASQRRDDTRVMAIGKTQYLKKSGMLDAFAAVEQIASIRDFPEKLAGRGDAEGRASVSTP